MSWNAVFENPVDPRITRLALDRLTRNYGFEWVAVRDSNVLRLARRNPDLVHVRVKPGTNEGRIVELVYVESRKYKGEWETNAWTFLQGKTFERRAEALVQGAKLAAAIARSR